jgi:hypothetical protein
MGRRLLGWLLVVAGVAGVSLFGPGLLWAARTAASAGATALPVTVAEAPTRRWVRLTDARVLCGTVRSARGVHVAVATDAAGAHPFLTQLTDPSRCESARLEGLFLDEVLTAARVQEAYGLEVPGAADLRVLGPPVGMGLALLAVAPVLVSAALALGGFWVGWRRRPVEAAAGAAPRGGPLTP